jgi:NlpC/P60 family putative phage cell wall peptidase
MRARGAVLREARRWIATPYRHQASCRGAGCDCLGLVRGIWRALYGAEPESVPPYTPDWAEVAGAETLREAALRHLVEIDRAAAKPGDVLLFRPDLKGPAKHCAILSGPDRIIHAYWGQAVAETALTPWWKRRCVAAFAFPDLPAPDTGLISKETLWPSLS